MAIRLFLAACLTVGFAGSAAAATYKVGLILPFSGVYAGLGKHIENGFQLGLEHFQGELDGHQIEVVREDTEANPAIGLSKARKLVLDDQVDVLAGVVSSGVLGGLRDFVHGTKVPLVVANAGNDLMTGELCSPYLVRVSFSNSMIVRPMGEWMYERGARSVYLMAPDYAAGHQMMDTFREEFKRAGGIIAGQSFPPLRGVRDYSPYLSTARAANPDALFVFFAGGSAITFVKQYQELGMQGEVPLFGAGWLTSPVYADVQGTAANGIIGSLNYTPAIENRENLRFQSDYQSRHESVGSEFAVAGYDAARAIIRAVAGAGEDKGELARLLRKSSFDGPRGPLRIDPATNNIIQNIYIFETSVLNGVSSYKILETIEDVRDDPNGCTLK